MSDADRSADHLAGYGFLQIGQLAHAPAYLNLPIPQDRDAGRIVPAILQTLEAIQKDGDCILVADISDDAAHPLILSPLSFPSRFRRPLRLAFHRPAMGPQEVTRAGGRPTPDYSLARPAQSRAHPLAHSPSRSSPPLSQLLAPL